MIFEKTPYYESAYQKRNGKCGVTFSGCFAAAISIQTEEVRSFELAYNGCRHCVKNKRNIKINDFL